MSIGQKKNRFYIFTKNSLILVLVFLGCKSTDESLTQSSLLPENKNATIINDYSSLLLADEKSLLSIRLYDYEIKTTNQIVFVSLDSISRYSDIQKYATDLSTYWGVGQKDKDNGLMIVLSKPLRQVGIATGLGTEKILTDSICKQIIVTTMTPYFKQDNYYEGISKGLDSIIYNGIRFQRLDIKF